VFVVSMNMSPFLLSPFWLLFAQLVQSGVCDIATKRRIALRSLDAGVFGGQFLLLLLENYRPQLVGRVSSLL